MKITELKNMGTQCPTQWEGWTEDGHAIYVRYRNGYGSVERSRYPTKDTGAVMHRYAVELFSWDSGDRLDGCLDYAQLKKIVESNTEIELPEQETK